MPAEVTDLAVIGSGAAGLAAALTAAMRGAHVTVYEATDLLGGTTSFSGALLWVPANRQQQAAGIPDTIETARRYIRHVLQDRAEDPRWDVFLANINPLVEGLLGTECGLGFELTHYPDSFGEWEDGRSTRHITPKPFPMSRLGPMKERIRQPPMRAQSLLSIAAMEKGDFITPTAPHSLVRILPTILADTFLGRRQMGFGLVSALVAACLRRGVTFRFDARVTELVAESSGPVTGLVYTQRGAERHVAARHGVMVASGGFSHDDSARDAYLPGPYVLPQEPPTNTGDALLLARQVGARLEAMDEAWYLPSAPLSDGYMGRAIGLPLIGDRMLPHQIWVNAAGKRFVNEGAQNAANAFYERSTDGSQPNLPCYSIFDQQYRKQFPIYMNYKPGKAGPPDMVTADSLEELARRIGVDTAGLVETVQRFNAMARAGRDTDFGRGEGAYERYFVGRHGNLGTIEAPPYHALPIYPGGVGTKGGLMTDADARVMDSSSIAIPGLYAAGNAAAAFNGPLTVAAGCTLTPALVMGHVGARHAVRDFSRR